MCLAAKILEQSLPSLRDHLIQDYRKGIRGPESLRDSSRGELVNGRTLACFSPEGEPLLGITVHQEVPRCLGPELQFPLV